LTLTPKEEEALVRRFASGDSDAAWRLLTTYGPDMHRLAYRMTGDADEAEDVVQEALLRVFRKSERFHGGSLAGWLRAVTSRVALNLYRAGHRLAQREALYAEESLPQESAPSDPLLRDALRDGIGRLPNGERIVFVLVELEGWSHTEVGAALSIAAEASRQRLLKARQRLRAEFHALRGSHE
jgi:RNA polymerase sigma-70 factor (ECF subfamily)